MIGVGTVESPYERLRAYLVARIEKLGRSHALAETDVYEGSRVYAFELPNGLRVMFRWWGDDVESFIVPLPMGTRIIARHSRLSEESAAQLTALLDEADAAAAKISAA